ncbi:hypothetical protein MAR_013408 [Mya arenaria]|uniref:Uncharacterized protein n=1 Tax=Mya arenaria TaxID=6604 RepID=A0ABY7G2F0_MYAAR|nr:hypothetical protein MAR_013408 [Mya arenaria]
MPMGCSISCSTFETFSTFLEWAIKISLCQKLAIPVADEKTVCQPFVQRLLSVGPECRYPADANSAGILDIFKDEVNYLFNQSVSKNTKQFTLLLASFIDPFSSICRTFV